MSSPAQLRPLGAPPFSPTLTGVFERYRQAVPQQRLTQILAGRSPFSRGGPLNAWVVIWLIIFQRLHPVGTLAVAVRELLTGPIQAFIRWFGQPPRRLSASTSAYSQARARLPLDVAEQVSDLIFESLFEPKNLPTLDRPVFLLDGSSVQTRHSDELASAFPPSRNRHGVSHWPVMRVVVAHDVVTGLAVRPGWGPMYGQHAVSEQALAKQLMARLPAGCGVLGDRNFGVFSMAYHAHQQSHPCLFRLTKARAQKLNGGFCPVSGTDKSIRWNSSGDDRRNNPEILPTTCLPGRLLVFRLKLGRRIEKVYLFTTFDLTANQILDLYGYRWNIETDLRWLKREVRLHMIEAESKAIVEKELVLAVSAYNLTRAAMNEAAAALQLDPRQLSYSLAQATINTFLPYLANAKTEAERQAVLQDMLHAFSYCRLPRRPKRRSFPRAVWPRTCTFPKRKSAKKSEASSRGKKLA
jgi:hypothetical protein